MVSNGSLHYDHDRDGTHTQLAGCEAQFRNREYDTYVAIRYHNYKLTVRFLQSRLSYT
jgi:mannose-binding lectin 2